MTSSDIFWVLLMFIPSYGLVFGLLAFVPLAKDKKQWEKKDTAILSLCVILSPLVFVASIAMFLAQGFHFVVKTIIEKSFNVTG